MNRYQILCTPEQTHKALEFSGIEYCGEPYGLCFVRTEQGYTYEGYCEYDYVERIPRKGRYKGFKYKKL